MPKARDLRWQISGPNPDRASPQRRKVFAALHYFDGQPSPSSAQDSV
jgi:hypothetical protein